MKYNSENATNLIVIKMPMYKKTEVLKIMLIQNIWIIAYEIKRIGCKLYDMIRYQNDENYVYRAFNTHDFKDISSKNDKLKKVYVQILFKFVLTKH